MRGRAALALLAMTTSAAMPAATSAAMAAEQLVSFPSRDAIFLDELMTPDGAAADRTITAALSLPTNGNGGGNGNVGPLPGAVIVPTSSGPSELEWSAAREMNAMGIATLLVDSYASRGLQTREARAQVTEAMILSDAFAALRFLARDRRFRSERIAVVGFSKGASVALYSAMAEIADALAGPAGPRFTAHLAYYPWCGLTLHDQRTTGAPVMVHMGERDNLTSPALCRALIAAIRRDDHQARIDLHLYPGVSHAFNHPTLAWLPPMTVGAQNSGTCRIVETAPRQYRETSTDRTLVSQNYRETLAECVGHGGVVNYNSEATAKASALSRDFLDAILRPAVPRL